MSEVQITQFEGDGIKRGIGGRDNCIINLMTHDKDGLVVFTPLSFSPTEGGNVRVTHGDKHSFVINKESWFEITEWLKSWDYI